MQFLHYFDNTIETSFPPNTSTEIEDFLRIYCVLKLANCLNNYIDLSSVK